MRARGQVLVDLLLAALLAAGSIIGSHAARGADPSAAGAAVVVSPIARAATAPPVGCAPAATTAACAVDCEHIAAGLIRVVK